MRRATTVIIGAGHAGLAMSRRLTERSIDHVILERGAVANSWKTERWDSLRLLTPNWQSRLPGFAYDGDDPDGFRDMTETVAFLEGYAQAISAPVEDATTVTAVRTCDDGYEVHTDRGPWRARTVVIATGACNLPAVPALASEIPAGLHTLSALEYRNPDQLPEGGVMVVGASSTGTQIGAEIQRSGRPVTISVGEHVRMPRLYRGRDITWWMDCSGVFDERWDEMENLDRARSLPSFQLAGTDDRRSVDLNALTDAGVRMVGRIAGIRDGTALFAGSLPNMCALADLKMNRLLDRIDAWIEEEGVTDGVPPAHRFEPTRLPEKLPLSLDLTDGSIRTVLWATGFRPDYSWLDVPVIDPKGRLRHDGGVVEAPGLYLIGIPFLRRRKSSLIDGAGDDARDLSAHLASYLADDQKSAARA